MASTQKAKIPVGFVIASKYRVTGELGRGGMAAVYEAENVDIGKPIPSEQFAAMAEVLRYVYQLKGKKLTDIKRAA